MNIKQSIKLIFYFHIIFCLTVIYSQSNQTSIGPAPKIDNPLSSFIPQSDNINYFNSRAFGYNAFGYAAPLGPFKMFLNSPTITNLSPDPLSDSYIAGASFASDGKLYGVRYGTNMLVKIDTTTGIITNIGYSGPGTGLAFDWTSNTMYMMSFNSASQLNTVNLSNGLLTPVGLTYNGCIIDIACSNNGTLYGVDINSDKFIRINKVNGVVQEIGSLGFNANYSQGMSWDHSTDSCYYASYNNATNQCEMRRMNIQNGSSTILYTINAQVDGFAISGKCLPLIYHKPYGGSENLYGPYIISCKITSEGSPINPSETKLFWSRNNITVTDSIIMNNTVGPNWVAYIPGNGTIAAYRYFIKAANSNGICLSPYGAPSVLNSFLSGPDIIKPRINHIPIIRTPKTLWPSEVFAYITDNIGIDSVWVRWYKNNLTDIKQFKLNLSSDSLYYNSFNSSQAEVWSGDSITYHIIAQDNSFNHNKDSTLDFTFKIIIALPQVCLGNQYYSSQYPFNSKVYNARTQLLYLKSDIINAGGNAGYITKIGFSFIDATGNFENLKVKVKHTDSNYVTLFDESGWNIVYNNNWAIQGEGLKFITFQTPFYWNGASNLIFEFCYHNSLIYDVVTRVNANTIQQKTLAASSDSQDGCTLIGGAAEFVTPNICLHINDLTSVKVIETSDKYSLEQNYPNPFNPFTRIKFSVPKTSLVKLSVYDLLGRIVSVPVNEIKRAGSYNVEFSGSNLATGVYFYVIEAGEYKQAKKMLLIK